MLNIEFFICLLMNFTKGPPLAFKHGQTTRRRSGGGELNWADANLRRRVNKKGKAPSFEITELNWVFTQRDKLPQKWAAHITSWATPLADAIKIVATGSG